MTSSIAAHRAIVGWPKLNSGVLSANNAPGNEHGTPATNMTDTIATNGNAFYQKYNRCTRCAEKYEKDVFRCPNCGYKLRTHAHNNPHRHPSQ